MPRKRRVTRRVPAIPEVERANILAGLYGKPRPAQGDLFAYWAGMHPRRQSPRWDHVEAVFRELPHPERRKIIAIRRDGMTGRVWIDRNTGRRRFYGIVGDSTPTAVPDLNDPRNVLRYDSDDAA